MRHDPKPDRASSTRDRIASELAGWGFFITGLVLLVSSALIPVHDDLVRMRHQRDTALVIEALHQSRIDKYEATLDSIERKDHDTIARLVHANLGLIPKDREALVAPGEPTDPMLFALLEPEPISAPRLTIERSRLERLMLDDRARLWSIALGALLMLVGLLPRATNNPL